MENLISCGVIIHDHAFILGCHPTYLPENHFDIPKGRMEKGESFFETAIRETLEETGYKADELAPLHELGLFDYMPEKDLYLFDCYVGSLKAIMRNKWPECTSSFFVDVNRKRIFENDAFRAIGLSEIDKYFSKRMAGVIHLALGLFEEGEEYLYD